jgi:uncharacterized protein
MKKILEFIRKERLYLLLLTFIILINYIVMSEGGSGRAGRQKEGKVEKAAVGTAAENEKEGKKDVFMKREDVEAALAKNKDLAVLFGLTSLFVAAVFLLGIVIDILLGARRLAKDNPVIYTYKTEPAKWGIWDVAKVVILFLFFGYMLVIIESFLLKSAPILKNDNFRMMVNTSILDILTVIFIVHFAVQQHRERLIALGLSLKNFTKNIFYGIVGYVAAVPILVAVLAIVALVVNITKYVPQQQPVVELFLKEENQPFLVYTSVFTAIIGPFIEELFFRGFMYNAFKKRIGIFWAMLVTSAVFASLHTNIVGFAPILVLGFVLAYVYERTGTLVSSITIHMLHNFSMVLFVFLIKQARI